ncbi:MAG: hotdog domain-containing protein [Actinomycetota bacterium]
MRSPSEIVGAVGFSSMSIRPGDSAIALGLGDLPIAATSHFLNLAESAAIAAVSEFLEAGETSRLSHLSLETFSAVAIGSSIRATAKCTKVEERTMYFDCDIYDGEREICRLKMERAVVERVSFLARTAAQSIAGQQI